MTSASRGVMNDRSKSSLSSCSVKGRLSVAELIRAWLLNKEMETQLV